jgi:hypothetical protein
LPLAREEGLQQRRGPNPGRASGEGWSDDEMSAGDLATLSGVANPAAARDPPVRIPRGGGVDEMDAADARP